MPPKGPSRKGCHGQVIEPFKPVIDAWLRADIMLNGTVIHERLVDQYGFTGNYQRVKLYLQQARPQVMEELGIGPDELAGLHRRFEVIPGAQAQVDWEMRETSSPRRGSRRCTPFTWSCPTLGIRSAASPHRWTWRRSGTATGGRSRTSAGPEDDRLRPDQDGRAPSCRPG